MNERRVSPVPAGSGMPGSMAGRPRPGLGRGAAQQLGAASSSLAAARLGIVLMQLVWRSGEAAISCRSAFWRQAAVLRFCW